MLPTRSSRTRTQSPARRARLGRRAMNVAAVLFAWQVAPTLAHADQAPDVVVLCDVSLREPLAAAGRAWRARTKIPVRVFVASLEQNASLIVHGVRADIIVGIGAKRIDDAQSLGALDRGAPVVIGRDPLVLAARATGGQPRALQPGDSIAGILGDGRLGLVDPAFGSAGPDARSSLSSVGLWPALESRSSGAETTDGLKQLLDDRVVRVVALYRTDLAGDPALSVMATFPGQAPPVVAALAKDPESPNARNFLAFLSGDGQSSLRQMGMEGP